MTNEIADQLRRLGAPPEQIAKAEANAAPAVTDFMVWEENWVAVGVFLDLSTQWDIAAGMAGALYLGLKYPALETVLRLRQIPPELWPELFQSIRIMEQAALPVLNKSNS